MPEPIDVAKLETNDLKAMVYDCLAMIELNQGNIKILQAEIAKRNQPKQEEIAK